MNAQVFASGPPGAVQTSLKLFGNSALTDPAQLRTEATDQAGLPAASSRFVDARPSKESWSNTPAGNGTAHAKQREV